jgi:pyridoxal/pyridoxine/pyridoxamine kinase
VPKSLKLFEYAEILQTRFIQYASPNQFELEAMCETIRSRPDLQARSVVFNASNQLKSRFIL